MLTDLTELKRTKKYYDVDDNVASSKFYELVRNSEIADYKRDHLLNAQEVLGTSKVEILSELRNWLYSDITDTIGLSVEEIKNLPIQLKRQIIEFEHTETTFEGRTTSKIKLKFVSKKDAIEMINRHIGFNEKDNIQSNSSLSPEERAERIKKLKERNNS